VISSALHRNFSGWMAGRPWEPEGFVDYLPRNKLSNSKGSASIQGSQVK
jgi:hypothetical protein